MQTDLKIAFHNMDPRPEVEADIRDRFEKLERLYDRITACRVSVEALHQQHRTGNIYDVHIDLVLPGQELAVSRQPKRANEKYAHPDVGTSVRDAFAAAERMLKTFRERQQRQVKPHAVDVVGQVTQLAEDHGFLLTNTGGLLYFHRNAVMDGNFASLTQGTRVRYVESMGDTGPIATKVWPDTDHPRDLS